MTWIGLDHYGGILLSGVLIVDDPCLQHGEHGPSTSAICITFLVASRVGTHLLAYKILPTIGYCKHVNFTVLQIAALAGALCSICLSSVFGAPQA